MKITLEGVKLPEWKWWQYGIILIMIILALKNTMNIDDVLRIIKLLE